MKNHFDISLNKLKTIIYIYDNKLINEKISLIKCISQLPLKKKENVILYHDMLLFIVSNPENKVIKKLADKELLRITDCIKNDHNFKIKFTDTSLPYTKIQIQFSHDIMIWINSYKQCKASINSFDKSGVDINKILKLTLPSLEQDLTTMGLNNDDLFKSLQIKKSQQLSFILNELSKLNDFPLVKDYLWESLQLNLEIESTDMRFSKTYNLLPKQTTFYQNEILKKFDHLELIHRLLPLPKAMSNKETDELSSIIKKSLVLTRRETDPSTYMENNTLRLYELERGISIAIFGMNANRQMPLQSYIGYTLFKNGYPVAYGGSWIFGRIGWFGLNIFETFRGGESGYIMCQLLRVYKQVFNLDKIEVEPYQYGLGNPDGIKSGAFWFYYRYGFIPIDENLCRLAESETKKIKNTPNYRTNDKTLLKFTESNIALSFGQTKSELLLEIIDKVRNVIAKKFNGNRDSAIKYCINEITKKLNNATFSENEKPSLIEVALMSNALNIIDNQQLILLDNMIKLKVNNPYLYNKNLSLFLDSI